MTADDATHPRAIADRFEDAQAGALVYVDERGRVVATRERTRAALRQYAGLGALLAGTNWLYWAMGGPAGLAIGGTFTLLILRQSWMGRSLERAMALTAAENLDAAQAELERLLRRLLLPVRLRARAEAAMARVASLRGDYGAALVWQNAALARGEGGARRGSERRMLEYNRAITLVNLDRVGEARGAFEAIPKALEGDYLRQLRAHAELYIAFAEGRHDFDVEALRERTESAIPLASGRPLLGLLAWAFGQIGRRDESAQLLALARARAGEALVTRLYPRLGAWMAEQPD
jgi:tetratricopeptide (TPR) repeat protein